MGTKELRLRSMEEKSKKRIDEEMRQIHDEKERVAQLVNELEDKQRKK